VSTTYNGSAAGIAAHEAPAITIAQSTDLLSEEGFNVALRKLADYVAYLNANAPLLAALNVFSATQQIADGDLELTKATIQALLKAGGGKLQVGTKTGNASDLELVVNGVVKAILRASDGKLQLVAQLLADAGIDANGQRIVDLADPVDDQDAATKAYVETVAANSAVVALTWNDPPWHQYGAADLLKGANGFVQLLARADYNGGGSNPTQTLTIPVGYRPPSSWTPILHVYDETAGALAAHAKLYPGTGLVTILGGYAPIVGHRYAFSGSWYASQ
jgi:hypothetical protein